MRLGDLDALKKKIKEHIDINVANELDTGWNLGLETAIFEIDNAPTVEIPKAIGTVDKNGDIKNELIRPQDDLISRIYVCPFCAHKIQVTEQFLPKDTECEVFGAEMKGGDKDV